MTITAPILLPGKTESALLQLIIDLVHTDDMENDREWLVFENKVIARVVDRTMDHTVHFIGLVHNRSTDPSYLLDMTAEWLRKQQ